MVWDERNLKIEMIEMRINRQIDRQMEPKESFKQGNVDI